MPTLPVAAIDPLPPGQAWFPWVTGRYYIVPNIAGTSTTATLGNGTLRATPFVIPTRVTLVRLGGEIASAGEAGSKLRLGLYRDDGTGRPGALVVDAGTIAGDSATVQEITISALVTPGLYWVAAAVQVAPSAQPTVRIQGGLGVVPTDVGSSIPGANATVIGVLQAGVTGALPDPFVTSGTHGAMPRTFVKVG